MNTNRMKFSFVNTLRYCFEGLVKEGWQESFRRFEHIWPLHLHRWIGWIYKIPVEQYYRKVNVTPVAGLMCDISSSNRHSLFYYAYAIKNLIQANGIKNLLLELARVDRAPDEDISHDGERKYHNLMVELHGCYFVHRQLRLKILDVEHASNKIFSPNRIGNKSCDIRGVDKSNVIFFECKDSSAEILSGEPYHGITITTPRNNFENKSWLLLKMQEADDKGADYLIAKIPLWSKFKGQKRINEWMSSVFEDSLFKRNNHFTIPVEENQYRCLKGCYILLRKKAIKISFRQTQ